MRVVRLTEKLGPECLIRLYHLTDLHVGAPDFDEEAFLERRALIEADPRARWTMGGDGGDLIRHNDRRYSPTELAPRYRHATDIRTASREHLRDLFKPIAAKCWGWADGNHERAMDELNGGKFGIEVCCDLGVEDRFVGYRGLIHVTAYLTKTQKLGLLLDLQHGWQAGRLKGAPMVQAERELGMTEADVVLRGHNHSPAAHTFVTLGVAQNGPGVVQRMRTVINGGTWRRGYRDNLAPVDRNNLAAVEGDLWGETKGFRAEPIGGPVLILKFIKGQGVGYGGSEHAHIRHTTIEGHIDSERLAA